MNTESAITQLADLYKARAAIKTADSKALRCHYVKVQAHDFLLSAEGYEMLIEQLARETETKIAAIEAELGVEAR